MHIHTQILINKHTSIFEALSLQELPYNSCLYLSLFITVIGKLGVVHGIAPFHGRLLLLISADLAKKFVQLVHFRSNVVFLTLWRTRWQSSHNQTCKWQQVIGHLGRCVLLRGRGWPGRRTAHSGGGRDDVKCVVAAK